MGSRLDGWARRPAASGQLPGLADNGDLEQRSAELIVAVLTGPLCDKTQLGIGSAVEDDDDIAAAGKSPANPDALTPDHVGCVRDDGEAGNLRQQFVQRGPLPGQEVGETQQAVNGRTKPVQAFLARAQSEAVSLLQIPEHTSRSGRHAGQEGRCGYAGIAVLAGLMPVMASRIYAASTSRADQPIAGPIDRQPGLVQLTCPDPVGPLDVHELIWLRGSGGQPQRRESGPVQHAGSGPIEVHPGLAGVATAAAAREESCHGQGHTGRDPGCTREDEAATDEPQSG